MSEPRRYEGPVVIAFSSEDPGDMGEPREFISDSTDALGRRVPTTYLTVPSPDLWASKEPEPGLRESALAVVSEFDYWTSEPRPASDGGTVRHHKFTEVQPEMERAFDALRAALRADQPPSKAATVPIMVVGEYAEAVADLLNHIEGEGYERSVAGDDVDRLEAIHRRIIDEYDPIDAALRADQPPSKGGAE